MPNQSIELHDSRVLGIHENQGQVDLDLDAYVHMSDGRPGIDAGTGYTMPVRFTVRSATVVRDFEGEGLWITDGSISVGSTVLDNMCPVALDVADAVQIRFVGHEGSLTVNGTGLHVEQIGEAVYIEEFPGSSG